MRLWRDEGQKDRNRGFPVWISMSAVVPRQVLCEGTFFKIKVQVGILSCVSFCRVLVQRFSCELNLARRVLKQYCGRISAHAAISYAM